jgi:hypothetical protein
MTAADLRQRMTERLLDEIGEVQYPSATMLDRVEKTLGSREALASYVETLIEKVEDERFPSVSVLDRIDGLLARLEQAEQQDGRRELTAA